MILYDSIPRFSAPYNWGTTEPHVPVAQWLEHCVSSAKVVGSIPREHTWRQNMYNLNAL